MVKWFIHGQTDQVIDSVKLKEIYDMDIDIQQINNNKICMYFT